MQTFPRVYAITPAAGSEESVKALTRQVAELLDDGWLIQLRQKQWSARQTVEFLFQVKRRTTVEALGRLLINGRCDIAMCAEKIGVHLPESGLPVDVARRLLGRDRLIGLSCHTEQGLAAAEQLGADFATISPIFESPGKGPALGIESIRGMSIPTRMAVYGLGGIDPTTAKGLSGTGLHGVACIRAVFDAAEPSVAARSLEASFLAARSSQG